MTVAAVAGAVDSHLAAYRERARTPNRWRQAGFAGVVASVWAVDDLSTALVDGRLLRGAGGGQ